MVRLECNPMIPLLPVNAAFMGTFVFGPALHQSPFDYCFAIKRKCGKVRMSEFPNGFLV